MLSNCVVFQKVKWLINMKLNVECGIDRVTIWLACGLCTRLTKRNKGDQHQARKCDVYQWLCKYVVCRFQQFEFLRRNTNLCCVTDHIHNMIKLLRYLEHFLHHPRWHNTGGLNRLCHLDSYADFIGIIRVSKCFNFYSQTNVFLYSEIQSLWHCFDNVFKRSQRLALCT